MVVPTSNTASANTVNYDAYLPEEDAPFGASPPPNVRMMTGASSVLPGSESDALSDDHFRAGSKGNAAPNDPSSGQSMRGAPHFHTTSGNLVGSNIMDNHFRSGFSPEAGGVSDNLNQTHASLASSNESTYGSATSRVLNARIRRLEKRIGADDMSSRNMSSTEHSSEFASLAQTPDGRGASSGSGIENLHGMEPATEESFILDGGNLSSPEIIQCDKKTGRGDGSPTPLRHRQSSGLFGEDGGDGGSSDGGSGSLHDGGAGNRNCRSTGLAGTALFNGNGSDNDEERDSLLGSGRAAAMSPDTGGDDGIARTPSYGSNENDLEHHDSPVNARRESTTMATATTTGGSSTGYGIVGAVKSSVINTPAWVSRPVLLVGSVWLLSRVIDINKSLAGAAASMGWGY